MSRHECVKGMRAIYLFYIIYLKWKSRGQGVGSRENFNENILTKFVLGGKGAGERGCPPHLLVLDTLCGVSKLWARDI